MRQFSQGSSSRTSSSETVGAVRRARDASVAGHGLRPEHEAIATARLTPVGDADTWVGSTRLSQASVPVRVSVQSTRVGSTDEAESVAIGIGAGNASSQRVVGEHLHVELLDGVDGDGVDYLVGEPDDSTTLLRALISRASGMPAPSGSAVSMSDKATLAGRVYDCQWDAVGLVHPHQKASERQNLIGGQGVGGHPLRLHAQIGGVAGRLCPALVLGVNVLLDQAIGHPPLPVADAKVRRHLVVGVGELVVRVALAGSDMDDAPKDRPGGPSVGTDGHLCSEGTQGHAS